jgi:C4-dicarboxylate-specific signal transduction histidine kinase
MLGYSDLLLNTNLTPDQKATATKIAQHVRRTRSLVASLISFAHHGTIPKNALDLNTLVRTAVKLTQPQSETLAIEVRSTFEPSLPKVLGDSNQLLQVFVQLLANSLHGLAQRGGTLLTVRTQMEVGNPTLQIMSGPMLAPTANSTEHGVEDDLGLAACEGIVQEHRGQIFRERQDDGTTSVRVQLPIAESPVLQSRESAAAPWQPRPYA